MISRATKILVQRVCNKYQRPVIVGRPTVYRPLIMDWRWCNQVVLCGGTIQVALSGGINTSLIYCVIFTRSLMFHSSQVCI